MGLCTKNRHIFFLHNLRSVFFVVGKTQTKTARFYLAILKSSNIDGSPTSQPYWRDGLSPLLNSTTISSRRESDSLGFDSIMETKGGLFHKALPVRAASTMGKAKWVQLNSTQTKPKKARVEGKKRNAILASQRPRYFCRRNPSKLD